MNIYELSFLTRAEIININKKGLLIATIKTDKKEDKEKLKKFYKEEVIEIVPEANNEITFCI